MIENGKSRVYEFKRALAVYTKIYNNFLADTASRHNSYNLQIYQDFYIPNNNNKFYCLIIKNVLYVFSLGGNKQIQSDFFVKLSNIFSDNMLIEGYIYNSNTFMITDILLLNKKGLNAHYNIRYNLLYKIFHPKLAVLENVNNKLTFKLHPVFTTVCESDENYLEVIRGHSKVNTKVSDIDTSVQYKIIRPGKQSDVYNVYNDSTLDDEGILYVKTINDSKILREKFKSTTEIRIKCIYNTQFSKYQASRLE